MMSCENYEQEICEALVNLIADIKNNSYSVILKPEPILNKIKDLNVLNTDKYKLKLAKDVELKLNKLMRHYFHLAQYKNGKQIVINIAGASANDISLFLFDNLIEPEDLKAEDKEISDEINQKLGKNKQLFIDTTVKLMIDRRFSVYEAYVIALLKAFEIKDEGIIGEAIRKTIEYNINAMKADFCYWSYINTQELFIIIVKKKEQLFKLAQIFNYELEYI